MNNMNMMQLFGTAMKSGNPKQFVLNLLQQNAQGNPVMESLLGLAQNGNKAGIEQIARNIVQSSGKDFDTEFANFKKQFGL